ncbi:lysophospholipid acyltransferase family protein [Paracoccus sp. TK19116]|uniref:Lysophospholipid acyltransferase family protein n=1 Tax=Paracoccus albicereus TaxID=2922394 RepID=A0ABT1MNW7_9RHOB|nr:lysophospholipid acyltransferase family protein [Paracoccus albicereus]MCQ0969990.1 lysophospholipid acyltransferase family protein [Paracoccus albicereus]
MDAKTEMHARLDPLIAERAPWFFSGKPQHALFRSVMMWLLHYPQTIRLAAEFRDLPTAEILRRMEAMIVRDVRVQGLENIPATGPALIVSNHPTGIADGIIMHALISQVRDDLFIYANHDMVRVLPQMQDLIAPVEWRLEKRSHAKTRATMDYTRTALESGRIGLIFPSGRLAKRRGLSLHERPWMASAVMIARKFDAPVIPLHIRARNSALFYLLDAIHPSLRDVTLFHEVLNKDGHTYRVTVGEPMDPATLPRNSEDSIAVLREAALALPEPEPDAPRLTRAHGRHRLVRGVRKTA